MQRLLSVILISLALIVPAEADQPAPPGTPPEVPAYAAGSWTLAVLPDTQYYSSTFPGLYLAQTAWLCTEAASLDLKYVVHLGDITDTATTLEWQRARLAMGLIDGVVPYTLCVGNHDLGSGGTARTRDTLLNEHFSFAEQAALPTFGGAFAEGELENTYHLFSAGGVEWLIMALEWAPRDEVIEWAAGVLGEHPERTGILVTHAYLNHNDTRLNHLTDGPGGYSPYDYGTQGSINDGEELWDKLVRGNNIRLVLCGHILEDGAGYLVSENDAGDEVHQILSNYQMGELGGSGILRLMEFLPEGTVQVRSYSPFYDGYLTTPDQQFSFCL